MTRKRLTAEAKQSRVDRWAFLPYANLTSACSDPPFAWVMWSLDEISTTITFWTPRLPTTIPLLLLYHRRSVKHAWVKYIRIEESASIRSFLSDDIPPPGTTIMIRKFVSTRDQPCRGVESVCLICQEVVAVRSNGWDYGFFFFFFLKLHRYFFWLFALLFVPAACVFVCNMPLCHTKYLDKMQSTRYLSYQYHPPRGFTIAFWPGSLHV